VVRVAGALLLIGAVLIGPSSARLLGAGPAIPAGADFGPGAVSAAEQSRVEAYWTDGRMRAAARGGAGIGGLLGPGGPDAAPLRGLRRAQPRPVSRAAAWSGAGAVARAVGRVFFTLGGQDYSCSGTAVTSRNRDTVITAGHCVNAGPGPYVHNWVFVPGYRAGARPYGTWTARGLAAPGGWVRSGRAPDDVGFAVLNTRHGQHLGTVVGALPIVFGLGPATYVWVFGFPGSAPYAGRRATYCRGTDRPDPFGTSALGLACTMTAGSSGGPWLAGFSAGGGGGAICSVTSFSYHGVPDVIWGPRLGDAAAALYTSVQRW
jgi:V8-like Glu-specific endopeptidase